ncbi:branched-chain amino acid ABC transporter permease [Amycolatopsis keratiniphila]|uniref:branched-chain amino acid ABC transporter permease n=1 Tax=Amycolatopsis keratiniphila TaxID=129921 RepID=UPI00087A5533|nr:branched-chain amino acid ABC transporter permease [Amycolatopsis keratiniphila]OLZ57834.1 branched-chain amino acid ABC transporter permease [Amycolatopsis keratiniphila subsp. nogabecina]SDU03255.1 amino acid/amide ABC transporter membrane protein 2, HAAT family [Amycolatopsis keratiniphila]
MLRRHLLSALAALVVVVLVLENSGPFLTAQFTTMAYLAIAAGGLTVLTGLNGQLSLGHGALMAVGAYSTALLLRSDALPLLVILLLAMVITLAVGALVGVAAARLHGPYLAGATLALAVAVPGIPLFFGESLGGEQGLPVRMPEIPAWLADAAYFVTGQDLTSIRYLAYLSWFAVIAVFVLLANLSRGRVGRDWRAVRDEDVAAELAGIDLARTRVRAFVVSAGCAGLAGALMALSARLAAPSGFALTLSLLLVSAVVLGGLGSLTGALAGAALLTFLPPLVTGAGTDLGLSDVQAAHLAPLLYGLVTVLIVLLAPAGLAGGLRKLIHWRRSS